MKIIVRQIKNGWRVTSESDSEILDVAGLMTHLKSKNYSMNSEEQSLLISNIPSEDNLCEIIQDYYGDLAEVYPF